MGFPAKYSGVCLKCTKPVTRGQLISWSRVKNQKGVYHLYCEANEPRIVPVVPVQPVHIEELSWLKKWEEAPIEVEEEKDEDLITPQPIEARKDQTMPLDQLDPNQAKALDALQTFLATLTPKTIEAPTLDIEAVKRVVKDTLSEEGTLKIEVRQADKPSVTIDLAHNKFADLLYFVSKRKHCYLHGPHGSGKSTGAQQVATALGLGYGYISLTPQTPESRLCGYMNATGGYTKTHFRDIYEHGGVFCVDELDNGSPALLTTLNGALENGHMAFPDGLISRHEDFIMVGTGNTSGKGANPSYPERRPFDSAFGDRFVYLEWGYDEQLEKKIALAINKDAKDWVKWILDVRKWASKNHPRFVPSPRATFRLAEFLKDNTVSKNDVLDAVVWRGDAELRNKVLANCPLPA